MIDDKQRVETLMKIDAQVTDVGAIIKEALAISAFANVPTDTQASALIAYGIDMLKRSGMPRSQLKAYVRDIIGVEE